MRPACAPRASELRLFAVLVSALIISAAAESSYIGKTTQLSATESERVNDLATSMGGGICTLWRVAPNTTRDVGPVWTSRDSA